MKEKNLIIQDTKSLTTKKDENKHLSLKEKNTSLVENKKKENALVKNTPKKRSLTTTSKKEKSLQPIRKKEKAITTTPASKKVSTKTSTKKQSVQKFTAHANEYFDLPYRYNETIIKLLAQTPKRLFVYWDISDKDRENYITNFGKDFFENTIPFLRIRNETQNYTFDIDINDFANSWYIDINDDNSKYSIELYRRFRKLPSFNDTPSTSLKNIQNITENPIFIVSSNKIDAPNGKVLSTTYPRTIQYRNIKTNTVTYKQIEKPSNEFNKLFFKDENYTTKTNATSSR